MEEDHGHETALNIARQLVMFLVRPGGQSLIQPYALAPGQRLCSRYGELQVWMLEHLREPLTVEQLADRVGVSARHFTRGLPSRETGMNPGQFVDRMPGGGRAADDR